MWKGIISESDFDLYEYGFNMGITVLLNLISTIVIGVIVGKVFESIAFLVFIYHWEAMPEDTTLAPRGGAILFP